MITRRNFIKVSALAGGGLMMSLALPYNLGRNKAFKKIEFSKFLTIDTNGAIIIVLTKHEMGQGTGTAVPMILADELGADWSNVVIKNADYDAKYTFAEMGTTGGSGSVHRIWDAIRLTGATAREMLKQAAANKWGIDKSILKVENSFVLNSKTMEKLAFGELAEAASTLSVPSNVKLKTPVEYVYIGKSIKNYFTKNVVRGKLRYGMDMDIDNMVYAAIERCPVYKGRLKSFDGEDARKIDGVIDIFPMVFPQSIYSTLNHQEGHVQQGVVVVARSTWIALKAKKLLQIVWDNGEHANKSIASLENEMTEAKDLVNLNFEIGNVEEEFRKEENEIIEVEYNNPHEAHALMEPLNATASYTGDLCEVWVAAQDGSIVNAEVAKIVELPTDKVKVHVLNSGGSFGRRYHVDSSIEAAFISKKLIKPVKVTWSREDEIRHDHFHPFQRNYFRAAITTKKQVSALENRAIKTTDFDISWSNKWNHIYYFPNLKGYSKSVTKIVHEGAWRSTSVHCSSLGKECLIDELAHKISKDPLDYRIELLSNAIDLGDPKDFPDWVVQYMIPARKIVIERNLKVLNYIKENSLWSKQMEKGKGKGMAIDNFGETVCAQIAEVSITDYGHGFRVDKITAVVHCGQLINPHFGKGQIEGSIIWALSALKYGGLEIENGTVLRDNFHNNKVLRIDESPEIEVIFIDSDDKPSGLGEPGTPPLAPAVLNAIFNASGKRIRKIPVTKSDIDNT